MHIATLKSKISTDSSQLQVRSSPILHPAWLGESTDVHTYRFSTTYIHSGITDSNERQAPPLLFTQALLLRSAYVHRKYSYEVCTYVVTSAYP